MSFQNELSEGFSLFLKMICDDHHADVLAMPYDEYSLQLFILYRDTIFKGLLHEDSALVKAFHEIGVHQPHDQLAIFFDTFYLYWRMQNKTIQ